MTDRLLFVQGVRGRVDVRRLMYQALIWRACARSFGGNQPSRLTPSFHLKDVERLADALVYCMGRDAELERDFLGRKMLVDKSEALALPFA